MFLTPFARFEYERWHFKGTQKVLVDLELVQFSGREAVVVLEKREDFSLPCDSTILASRTGAVGEEGTAAYLVQGMRCIAVACHVCHDQSVDLDAQNG